MNRAEVSERFWSKVEKDQAGCWLWTGARTPKGYGRFRIGDAMFYAHRVSWLLAGESPDPKPLMHKCDTPACVRPSHLRLGTPRENSGDMKAKGRQAQGERHWNRRLGASEVVEIRQRRAAGESIKALAEIFGVSESSISLISNRKKWRSV
jgi:hypothetical protein